MIFDTSRRSFSMSSPFLPITTPGRAVKIVMSAFFCGRLIRIFDTPAWDSLSLRSARTLRSDTRCSAYWRLPANHLEFQSLEMPRRIPIGLTL